MTTSSYPPAAHGDQTTKARASLRPHFTAAHALVQTSEEIHTILRMLRALVHDGLADQTLIPKEALGAVSVMNHVIAKMLEARRQNSELAVGLRERLAELEQCDFAAIELHLCAVNLASRMAERVGAEELATLENLVAATGEFERGATMLADELGGTP